MSFCCSECRYRYYGHSRSEDGSQIIKYASLKCAFCNLYPLHEAILNRASDDIILALIQANKDAAHQLDSSRALPLHCAIQRKLSDTVILALIDANKDVANKLNPNGELPVKAAMKLGYSDTVVLALLEANKYDANNWYDDGRSPLHKAVEFRCSDKVILTLLQASKDDANKQDNNGRLPLYTAMERRCSDNVVFALIEATKDAAKLDHRGELSLHHAIASQCSDKVILAILEAHKDATNKPNRNGEFPLQKAIEKKCSDKVILAVLETNKGAANKMVGHRGLPLRNAIQLKSSDVVVLALLEATKQSEHYHDLLLHEALDFKLSDMVILALLAANKDGASQLNLNGTLPLHKALDNKLSDNVILALLAANNDAAKKEFNSYPGMLSLNGQPNLNGTLPLHKALDNKLSDNVILALLAANKDAAKKADHYGKLPLQKAMELKLSDQVILALLAAYEYASNIIVTHNWQILPLHLAIENNCSNGVILALLAANSNAASRKNHYQKLPLLMAIESNFNEEIISALVTAYPDAACGRDSNNMVLIQHAIQKGYSDSLLAELLAAVFNSKHRDNESQRDVTLRIMIQGNREQVVLKAAAILPDHERHNMLCNIIEKTNVESVLVSLASKYPSVTTVSFVYGPVNKAITYKRSDEVILALLEVNKYYAKKDKNGSHNPLHTAMYHKRSDNVVLALLAANPDAAVELDSIDGTTKNNMLPIQHALKMNYSDAVVIALLIAVVNKSDLSGNYQNVLTNIVQTKRGELVLQAAKGLNDVARQNIILRSLIETVASDSLVLSMVSEFPETLKMRCSNGYFALHIALDLKRSEDVLFAIFNGNKEASKEKCVSGELPLHQAIRNQYSEEFVLALFDAYNIASQKESVDGELPMHQAIKNEYSDQVALKILSAYPCAAMIPCKTSGKLPLHFAAASSASPRLVESLIAEYPEALEIAVNSLFPRNMVTSALPTESIKLICRPSLHNKEIRPAQHAEQGKAEESGDTESLKQVASEVAKMAEMFEGFCRNLLELNVKVDAVQKRLEEPSTEPNSRVSLVNNASSLLGGSTAGDFDPLGMPIAFIPPITKITGKKKKNRMKKKTAEVVKENNNDPIDFSESQSLATVVDLSYLSCNDATTLNAKSNAAPQQSETFELSHLFAKQVDPLQLMKQQNSFIEALLRSQTSAAECSATKVTDVCASKLSDVKVDFDEVPHASEVNSKVSFSAQSSECGTIASEANLLDVSSNGSNSANFNSYVIVGKHIREKSLGAPELVDKVMVEHNPKTDNLDEVESCTLLEKVSSKSSLSGSSDGSFSFVDNGMSNSDTGESVKDNEDIISIKSSVD